MEINIENGIPAFDYIVEALKGISRGENIIVNSSIENVGTVIDFETGLHRIYPFYFVEVYSDDFGFRIGKYKSQVVQINLKKKEDNKSKKKLYSWCKLKNGTDKEVVALSSIYRRKFSNLFEEELSRYINLPEKRGKVGVRLQYGYPPYFYISLPYQNAEEVNGFYPLATEKEKAVNKKTLNSIKHPIFWNSEGKWMGTALNIFVGKYDLEEVERRYKIEKEKIEDKIEKLKTPLFKIIRDELIHEDFNDVLNELKCPEEYKRLLLEPVFKSIRYLSANGHSDKIVEEYNKWAKENGYEKISEGYLEDF